MTPVTPKGVSITSNFPATILYKALTPSYRHFSTAFLLTLWGRCSWGRSSMASSVSLSRYSLHGEPEPAEIERKIEHSRVARDFPDTKVPRGELQPAHQNIAAGICNFAIIEKRNFLRECLARSLSSCSTIAVESFSSVDEVLNSSGSLEASLMILSVVRLSEGEATQELISLFQAMPHLPTIVLAHEEDISGALEALGIGAKGYIPASLGFEIAIEAMRFVNAGGTYIPAECLLAARRPSASIARNNAAGTITNRELAVI